MEPTDVLPLETQPSDPRSLPTVGWSVVIFFGVAQIRSVAGADYEADGVTPPGDLRPSAR